MAIQLRWVGEADYALVGQTRHRCYGGALKDHERFSTSVTEDPRGKAGDFLLAESHGEAVGTLTSLSLKIGLRGGVLPCQGIAWVGTTRTNRRSGGRSQPGIATQLMQAAILRAREREEPVVQRRVGDVLALHDPPLEVPEGTPALMVRGIVP